MRKFIALALFLYVSAANAVDVTKLDGLYGGYPDFGCEQLVMFAYSAAKDSRDKGYKMDNMIAWIDHDNNSIRSNPARTALGDKYFDDMAKFLKYLTVQIWKAKDVSPEEIRDITRTNCDGWKGETEQFISIQVAHDFRKQVPPSSDK